MKDNLMNRKKQFITKSEKETFLLGKQLAKSFRGKEIVFLRGELGAGKTVFAKGLASGMGLKDVNQVCSPSFTLINIYQAKFPIYHIDLYRLEKDEEILDLGWEDYIGEGVIIVEWAEKVSFQLDAIQVTLKIRDGDQRYITIYQKFVQPRLEGEK